MYTTLPQAAPVRLVPGAAIGDHVIAWLIGVGGCGSVYAARHRADGRLVAIKVMNAAVSV